MKNFSLNIIWLNDWILGTLPLKRLLSVIWECHLKKQSVSSQWCSANCALFADVDHITNRRIISARIGSLRELLRGPQKRELPWLTRVVAQLFSFIFCIAIYYAKSHHQKLLQILTIHMNLLSCHITDDSYVNSSMCIHISHYFNIIIVSFYVVKCILSTELFIPPSIIISLFAGITIYRFNFRFRLISNCMHFHRLAKARNTIHSIKWNDNQNYLYDKFINTAESTMRVASSRDTVLCIWSHSCKKYCRSAQKWFCFTCSLSLPSVFGWVQFSKNHLFSK